MTKKKVTTGRWKSDKDCVYTTKHQKNGGDIIATRPDYENSHNNWEANRKTIAASKDMQRLLEKMSKGKLSIDNFQKYRIVARKLLKQINS